MRLRGPVLIMLHKPAGYLTAADDPFVPAEIFDAEPLRANPHVATVVTRHGGHCAFVESLSGDGFAERWVADRLGAALPRR